MNARQTPPSAVRPHSLQPLDSECRLCVFFSTGTGRWWDELTPEMSVDNLIHAFALWLQALESENRSPQTIALYEGRCRQFLAYLTTQGDGGRFALASLSADNVRRASTWIREQSAGRRGGESAARALVVTLKTASAWLADECVLPVHALARVKRPTVSRSAQTPFGQEEVRSLVAAAGRSANGARDIAIIHLLLDTGMRVGGLCSIMLQDLNLRDRRLELRLKGGRRQALYFGSPSRRDGGHTVRTLRAYLNERERLVQRQRSLNGDHSQGRLFLGRDGWPLKESGVRQILNRLAQDAHVSNVHPHRFRHTMATWYLVRHPGDETGLRGILGHLSDDMYRVYVHLSSEIIAQRAGRTSLAEAWLGGGDDEEQSQESAPTYEPHASARSLSGVDRLALVEAVRSDDDLRRELLKALLGAS